MWQSVSMKNKNMRDMEKHWAEQKKKAAKPANRQLGQNVRTQTRPRRRQKDAKEETSEKA